MSLSLASTTTSAAVVSAENAMDAMGVIGLMAEVLGYCTAFTDKHAVARVRIDCATRGRPDNTSDTHPG
jgi:hypothetical protein